MIKIKGLLEDEKILMINCGTKSSLVHHNSRCPRRQCPLLGSARRSRRLSAFRLDSATHCAFASDLRSRYLKKIRIKIIVYIFHIKKTVKLKKNEQKILLKELKLIQKSIKILVYARKFKIHFHDYYT